MSFGQQSCIASPRISCSHQHSDSTYMVQPQMTDAIRAEQAGHAEFAALAHSLILRLFVIPTASASSPSPVLQQTSTYRCLWSVNILLVIEVKMAAFAWSWHALLSPLCSSENAPCASLNRPSVLVLWSRLVHIHAAQP
eukprot:6186950-Pleurochrysis_carterae.AAC.3